MEHIIQVHPVEIRSKQQTKVKLSCKYCFKDLSSRQNLKEHIYIHTGEKPYICTEPGCNQTFRQGSLLSIHRRIHSEVMKGRSALLSKVKVIKYPKLTDLMISKFQKNDESFSEIQKALDEIKEEDFGFIKEFL
jgi:hypothetical protein